MDVNVLVLRRCKQVAESEVEAGSPWAVLSSVVRLAQVIFVDRQAEAMSRSVGMGRRGCAMGRRSSLKM